MREKSFFAKTFGTLFEQPQKKTLSGSQTEFWTTKTSRLTPRCFCWQICSFGMSALSKHSLKERKSYMVLICTFRDCEFLFRVEPFVLVGMNKSGNSQTAPAPKNAELCIMALSQPQNKRRKRQGDSGKCNSSQKRIFCKDSMRGKQMISAGLKLSPINSLKLVFTL